VFIAGGGRGVVKKEGIKTRSLVRSIWDYGGGGGSQCDKKVKSGVETLMEEILSIWGGKKKEGVVLLGGEIDSSREGLL